MSKKLTPQEELIALALKRAEEAGETHPEIWPASAALLINAMATAYAVGVRVTMNKDPALDVDKAVETVSALFREAYLDAAKVPITLVSDPDDGDPINLPGLGGGPWH